MDLVFNCMIILDNFFQKVFYIFCIRIFQTY